MSLRIGVEQERGHCDVPLSQSLRSAIQVCSSFSDFLKIEFKYLKNTN